MKLIKKYTALILALFLIVAGASIAEYKAFPYLFTGRWQPSEDPLLIDANGYQDIQNLRRDGNRLRGVSGHTRALSDAISLPYIKNAFHFQKFQPAESHILIHSENAAGSERKIFSGRKNGSCHLSR